MFGRIMVPLDGSPTSEWILPPAARLAPDAHWTFLRAVDVTIAGEADIGPFVDFLQKEASEQLERTAARFTSRLGRITTRVEFGDPSHLILREARPETFDLVALTTHGRAGFERWMLGSVAEKVLRGCELPVLVARNEVARRDEDAPMRRVAIALDGLPFSEQVLPAAQRIAKENDAELHVLHIVEPMAYPKDTKIGKVVLDRLMRFQDRVHDIERDLAHQGLKTLYFVSTGNPAARIADYCRDTPVDLLVMATHGRSGIGRWFLGSVTEKVLRASETPMLVVRCRELSQS